MLLFRCTSRDLSVSSSQYLFLFNAEADPCPNDFRPFDGKCHEEGLHFSQLDSLQKLRKMFPSTAITDDCRWSDGETASAFDLVHIQCVRAVQVLPVHPF